MRKILLIALVAVFAVAMCACSSQTINDQITDALDQAQGNLDTESSSSDLQALLDSLKEDVDASVPSESEPADPGEGNDTDGEDTALSEGDGSETGEKLDTHTELFEIKYIGDKEDQAIFGLRQVVWVNPDDKDLIEQYGLQDADFDDDYELVIPSEDFTECYAYKDVTMFSVVDYETDLADKSVTCDEFVNILQNEIDDHTMLVECTVTGNYIFVVKQVYVP